MTDDEDNGTEIVTVAIPMWAAVRCPICGDVAVDLNGDLVCCSREECEAGAAFRHMVEPQKVEATRRLRLVGKHVDGCDYCQHADDRRGLCRTGRELWGRWVAWLIPPPSPPASVKVRPLTAVEQTMLQPILAELHAHVESCVECQNAPPPASAAEFGENNLCAVGKPLYQRWIEWLKSSS